MSTFIRWYSWSYWANSRLNVEHPCEIYKEYKLLVPVEATSKNSIYLVLRNFMWKPSIIRRK